jgi:hypothetical protein
MRARNIKPGFFKNEALHEVDPYARLLFIGLWCLADREGRLEDRPKRIKVELFPADSVDVDAMLEQLAKAGMVIRYEADGQRIISIPNFLKHQHPHHLEKSSNFPDLPPVHDAIKQPKPGTLAPMDGGKVSDKSQASLSLIRLNPDSLNPESLNPESSEPTPSGEVLSKPKFQDTPEGLAQEFVFHSTRMKNRVKADKPDEVAPQMAGLLKAGLTADQIRTEIHREARDEAEYFWEFRKRLLDGAKANPPPRKPERPPGSGNARLDEKYGKV